MALLEIRNIETYYGPVMAMAAAITLLLMAIRPGARSQ